MRKKFGQIGSGHSSFRIKREKIGSVLGKIFGSRFGSDKSPDRKKVRDSSNSYIPEIYVLLCFVFLA